MRIFILFGGGPEQGDHAQRAPHAEGLPGKCVCEIKHSGLQQGARVRELRFGNPTPSRSRGRQHSVFIGRTPDVTDDDNTCSHIYARNRAGWPFSVGGARRALARDPFRTEPP